MISAQQALSDLERAILGVRSDEDRLTAMLSQASGELDRLRGEKAAAFRALARLRLDAIARDEVVGALGSVERRAQAALEERRKRLDEARAARAAAAHHFAELEEARLEKARVRDGAIAAVDKMSDAVEDAVRDDAAWRMLEAAVGAAAAKATAAREKAGQAEADRQAKGRPYERDRLFMYLWKAGYGTSAYRAGAVVRYFDAKVAALCRFEAARANYFMLNEIPLRLGEHADRLEADVKAAEAARGEYERKALVAAGIEPLEAAATAAGAALAKLESEMERVKAGLAAMDGELGTLMDVNADPAVKGVLDELSATLERADLAELWKKALATATAEDDRIIDQLKRIERDVVRFTAETEELRRAAMDLAAKRLELEHSRDHFRARGYDREPGGFDNGAAIGGLIEGVIRGAITAAVLDGAFDKGYRRARRRRPRDFGGGSWGGSSGGFGGGGFGTGGGFGGGGSGGGGGFRTGGGF